MQFSQRAGATAIVPCWSDRDAVADERLPSLHAWRVLYVRSRQEKILAEDLAAMDIEHYLPLIRRSRYYGRRKTSVETPLFPGYLFLMGTLEDAYRADRTGRVARIISAPDQIRLDWELKNLRLALSRQAPLELYPCLERGVRVEVRGGPFNGLQGLIEDRVGADRLVLQVKALGAACSLEIDATLLEPLS